MAQDGCVTVRRTSTLLPCRLTALPPCRLAALPPSPQAVSTTFSQLSSFLRNIS
jgi:hypothetical protein